MAARIPLVIVNGEFQQLQAGDTLAATVTEREVISMTAAVALIAGQVCYVSAASNVNKARANASGTSIVLGLATAAVSSSAAGDIQSSGVLSLTTAQWDAVFGTTGGLTAYTQYFLSAGTAGLGTSTAPSTVGQYVVLLGHALSTVDFLIRVGPRVLL